MLETHMRRIDQEVLAVSVMPGQVQAVAPQSRLAELSVRQRQIVERLLEGRRVGSIPPASSASAPATERHHLSLEFRKLGVRSRAASIPVSQSYEQGALAVVRHLGAAGWSG